MCTRKYLTHTTMSNSPRPGALHLLPRFLFPSSTPKPNLPHDHSQILLQISSQAFLQPGPTGPPHFLQNSLCPCSRSNDAGVIFKTWNIIDELPARKHGAKNAQQTVPVPGGCECEDALVSDVGARQERDVEACGILYIDKVFCGDERIKRNAGQSTYVGSSGNRVHVRGFHVLSLASVDAPLKSSVIQPDVVGCP